MDEATKIKSGPFRVLEQNQKASTQQKSELFSGCGEKWQPKRARPQDANGSVNVMEVARRNRRLPFFLE